MISQEEDEFRFDREVMRLWLPRLVEEKDSICEAADREMLQLETFEREDKLRHKEHMPRLEAIELQHEENMRRLEAIGREMQCKDEASEREKQRKHKAAAREKQRMHEAAEREIWRKYKREDEL